MLTIEGVIEDLKSRRQYPDYVLSDFFTFLVERIIYNDKYADKSVFLNGQMLSFLIPFVIGLFASIPSVSLKPLTYGFIIGVALFIAIGLWKKKERDKYNKSLEEMISEYEQLKSEAELNRDGLYAIDVIYPDYRSLIPVSKFRKYIESGLRSKLEGADGAYDLYEQERRHGEILEKIEDVEGAVLQVSQQLEIMTQNQYIQIEIAEACNKKMDTLCDAAYNAMQTGQKLIDQVGFIQYNTELSNKHFEHLENYMNEFISSAEKSLSDISAIKSNTKDAAEYARETAHNTRETEEYAREIWNNT